MTHRASLSFLALFFLGCSGTALDVGSTDAGPSTAKDGGHSNFVPGSDDGGVDVSFGPDASDAPGVTTAKAVCAQNSKVDFSGTATSQTPAGITAKLVGRWYSCDATVPSAMRSTPAIEFDADGTWTRLVDDGAGGMTPSPGADGAGTWKIFRSDGAFVDATDTTPGTYPYIYIVNSMGGEAPTQMTFNDLPRLLFTLEATSGLSTFLVPLT